jgi:hypothetical protein
MKLSYDPLDQDISWFPKSGPTSVVAIAWWWIHIPFHSIWRLSNSFHMFGVDLRTIPCGLGASTITAQGRHSAPSSDPGFQLISQILTNKFGGNGMMMDPYPLPQHMKIVK